MNSLKYCILSIAMIWCFGPIALMAQEDSLYQDEDYYEEDYYEEEMEYYSEPVGLLFGLDFSMDIPVFLSYQNGIKTSYGFQTELLYQIRRTSAVFMGLSFSIGQYEAESVEYYDYTEFEENLFRESTKGNVMHLHYKTRYFPDWDFWVLEPFIDLVIGARNSFASTTVYNVDYGENVSTSFHEADWGLEYGGGIGTLIMVEDEDISNMFFHLSVNYLGGENSFFYLLKDNITGMEDPIDRLDRKSLPYQFLKLNLGILAYF